MINSKWVFGPENLNEVLRIRKKVLEEELGYNEITDAEDDTALHVLIGEDDVYYTCGRIYDNAGKFYIDMICVDDRVRGKSLGSLTVRLLIDRGFELWAKEIYTNATADTADFFRKLNFDVCGDNYIDHNGQEIIPMILKKENSPIKNSCSGCSNCDSCENGCL